LEDVVGTWLVWRGFKTTLLSCARFLCGSWKRCWNGSR